MRRPCASFILVAALAAFVSTFFLPTTRETQRLTWRMLLGRPPANTRCLGADPCYMVPYICLSNEFRQGLRARMHNDPDAYILSFCLLAGFDGFPPAQAWASHPLARWAAMGAAGRIRFLRLGTRPADPSEIGVLAGNPGVQNLLDTLRRLQGEFPGEGGLRLAEAVVRFELGQQSEACDAVRTAIRCPRWTPTMDVFPGYAASLLQASGLPRLEAASTASNVSWMEPHGRLLRESSAALLRLAASALQVGEPDAADGMLLNWVALAECARDAVGLPVELRNDGFEELVSAMAGRLGCPVPGRENGNDYESRDYSREQILQDYLALCTAPGLADRLRLEDLLQRQMAEVWRRRCSARSELRNVSDRVLPGLSGSLSVLLIGLLGAALLAELPFLLAPPVRLGSREIFPPGFLFILLLAFAAMTIALFFTCRAVFGTEDLTVRRVVLLPGTYVLVVFASCIAFAIAGLRRLSTWQPGWYRAGCLVLFVLYLVALWGAAQVRDEALQCQLLSLAW